MKMKIMIADDDDDDIKILKEVLEDIFDNRQILFSIQTAKNGVELMNNLEKEIDLPQLLFLDINMPIQDGFVCLNKIKTTDRYKHITVIMLSTSTFHGDIRRAYEIGAALYVAKATDYSNFKNKIENCLELFKEAGLLI